ncbi:MAG: hypothetical protein MJY58_00830 [Bacteroidaceae bacterium]|nr:hypothetical protein [Bacteroidaceae bacterium]
MRRFCIILFLMPVLVSCSSLSSSRRTEGDAALGASSVAAQDYIFTKAVQNIAEDRYDSALDLLQYGLAADTSNAAGCYYLAQLYMSFRERSVVRQYMPVCDSLLTKAVRLAPDNFWYRRLLAINMLRMGRREEAVVQYEELARRFPGNSDILLNLAGLYDELGQYDKELRVLTRYGQIEDVADELRMQRVACYIEMNELDSAYLETDEPDRILEILTDGVSRMLDMIETEMDRINCRSMVDMVSRFADVALKYDSSLYQAWKSKAITQLWTDKPDMAVNTIKSGIMMVTDSLSKSKLYSMSADLCYSMNRDREMIYADYDSALVFNPADDMVMNNYAYFLSLDGRDLQRALDMSARSIAKEPFNATYLDTYAWILFRMELYEDARDYLEKALQYMEEPAADLYEHMGDVQYMCGDSDAALEYWHRAVQLNSDSKLLDRKIREKKYLEE